MRAGERNRQGQITGPRPSRLDKPREPDNPRVPLDGKLVVAVVYQVQVLRESPTTAMVRRERVSDHETEQQAEAEIRRLQAISNGSANGQSHAIAN